MCTLDWNLVDGHLCTVRLDGSSRANHIRLEHLCLIVVCLQLPDTESQFCRNVHRLFRSVQVVEFVVVADNLNTRAGFLGHHKTKLETYFLLQVTAVVPSFRFVTTANYFWCTRNSIRKPTSAYLVPSCVFMPLDFD